MKSWASYLPPLTTTLFAFSSSSSNSNNCWPNANSELRSFLWPGRSVYRTVKSSSTKCFEHIDEFLVGVKFCCDKSTNFAQFYLLCFASGLSSLGNGIVKRKTASFGFGVLSQPHTAQQLGIPLHIYLFQRRF